MNTGTYHRIMLLVLLLLVGCGTSLTDSTPITTSATRSAATAFSASVAAPTPDGLIAENIVLPARWRYMTWQGLRVPLPPQAAGIVPSPATAMDQTHQVPVLAAGSLDVPTPPAPSLTILQFRGTIDEWIAAEEETLDSEDGGVMEPVESLAVAGREARHYQRTVSGFGYNDYYVVKPNEATLLLIYTDAATYGPLVKGLVFAAP